MDGRNAADPLFHRYCLDGWDQCPGFLTGCFITGNQKRRRTIVASQRHSHADFRQATAIDRQIVGMECMAEDSAGMIGTGGLEAKDMALKTARPRSARVTIASMKRSG